jgi:hypothetical protein
MAPLFGPLSSAGFGDPSYMYGYPGSFDPSYPVLTDGPYSPVLPAPAVRFSRPSALNPSPVGVVGAQTTRADRLFGPFASLGAAGGPAPGL